MKLALVTDDDDASDRALVERMASRDREALGELYDRHHRALYGFLARVYGDREADIDDLVQTTFLEAFRAASRYRAASSPRTWLFAIGHNVVRMHRRATRRRDRAHERLAALPERSVALPDAKLADRHALARVEAALDALPPDVRVAYVICVIEGVTAEEASRALGVARGTIWRRVHEARKALSAAVDTEGAR